MSREMLDGLIEESNPERSEVYQAGEHFGVDFRVIEGLLSSYLDVITWGRMNFDRLVDHLAELLGDAGDLHNDASEFLEEYVRHFARVVSYGTYYWDLYLCAVVQALYRLGHNDLELDVTPLGEPFSIYELYGESTDPLRLRFKTFGLSDRRGGSYVGGFRNAEVTVIGACRSGGAYSENSLFDFQDHVGEVGRDAKQCIFHLRSTGSPSPKASDSDFYLWDAPLEEYELKLLRKAGFFENGNRLYLCKDEETYSETTPVEDVSGWRSFLGRYTFQSRECEGPVPWHN